MDSLLRITLIWFGFFVLAFVNGALREIGIKKFLQEPWAHHLSALTAVLFFSFYLYLMWDKAHITTVKQSLGVGAYWLVLTVLAETFIVGRLMGKQSWEEIFAAYNILSGNLWPLVLLWVFISPYVFLRLMR